MRMVRFALVALLALLPACASMKSDKPQRGIAGKVQKVYQVVLQGKDVPGMRHLGRVGDVFAAPLRKARTGETNQYVVSTPTGQILAQADDEFAVGECVEVIPRGDAYGPAYPYGQAQVVKSDSCAS